MKTPSALLAGLVAALAWPTAALAIQTVTYANLTRNGSVATSPVFAVAGDKIKFDAFLTANGAANPPGTTGLGLCLEYKRGATGDPVVANRLITGLLGGGAPATLSGCTVGGAVNVAGADTMIVFAWAAVTGSWPDVAIPLKLFDAEYTMPGTPQGAGRIGFGARTVSTGQTFSGGDPIVVCGRPTVTLTTTQNGSEAGTIPALVVVTLSAAVPADCGVNGVFNVAMALGGTAIPPSQANADYAVGGNGIVQAGSTVTAAFPADGATTSLTIAVVPTADSTAESDETVTLTVLAGSGNYLGVGAGTSAVLSDSAPLPSVVEYVDTADFPSSPGGHFFYSSDPAEQAAVDAGAAGHFVRTGRQFRTGGTTPVCRFYGSINPGPNSHFFTVDANECAALRAAQVVPTPATVQQWNYEGIAYATTPPLVASDGTRSCPAGTQPLYRAYNNAFPLSGPKNPWDSNHRFTPSHDDVVVLIGLGWRDEGIAYCTPP